MRTASLVWLQCSTGETQLFQHFNTVFLEILNVLLRTVFADPVTYILHHITPPVMNALGVNTKTDTQTHTHTDVQIKAISRNQVRASRPWLKNTIYINKAPLYYTNSPHLSY